MQLSSEDQSRRTNERKLNRRATQTYKIKRTLNSNGCFRTEVSGPGPGGPPARWSWGATGPLSLGGHRGAPASWFQVLLCSNMPDLNQRVTNSLLQNIKRELNASLTLH